MATTLTIPLVTLPVGARTVGPHNAADAETSITLTIDRTVAAGLNALTAASGIAADVQISSDGGATWLDLGAWTAVGGPITYTDKNQVVHVYQASAGTWPLPAGTSRQLQAVVTISGPSPIAVAGTLVTT